METQLDTLDTTAQIVKLLTNKKITIGTAESVTGGLIGSCLVDISGASKVYQGTLVTYNVELKKTILGIKDVIIDGDAVNMETAVYMARKICPFLNCDIGISTTGIAECLDDRPQQAFVCIYLKKDDRILNQKHFVCPETTQRNEARKYFAKMTLELLLSEISKL